MKKGDLVKIYQYPVAKEEFEGWATLVSEYRPDEGDGLSIWEVYFLDQQITSYPNKTHFRTIHDMISKKEDERHE